MEADPHPPVESPAQRLYALDNLRALMMWLGIVLHVAVIHLAQDSPLPWRDDRTTRLADLLVPFIHAFRMPVFFILAGFFVHQLVRSRGPQGMLQHRLKRLGLPFVLFWPPVFAACIVFALLFFNRMAGTWGLDPRFIPKVPQVANGPSTMHLWFLWMLLWFCVLTAALLRLTHWSAGHQPNALVRLLARLGAAPWGFAVLTLPLAWVGSLYPNGVVAPSGHFIPPWAEWVHNGLFYVFGWALYAQRETLLALYVRRWAWYAAGGLLFFMLTGAAVERMRPAGAPGHDWLWLTSAALYNACTWLWSFALIGLFLRHAGRQDRRLAWLADSAYWVYLIHLPLTIGFGALLYGQPLPAGAKMLVNIAATTAVCLASYQLLVRHGAIGQLLNGKRHPRRGHPVGTTAHAN